MRHTVLKTTIVSVCFFVVLGAGSWVYANTMDLVGLLTKNLNVTDQQAQGGAGAIFKAASENMSAEDFTKVNKALPEVQALMDSVPALDTGTGSLGGLSSALGKTGSGISSLAGLAGTFSQLGLGGDMVQQFIPIILNYAQSKGGDTVANLLQMALQ